MNKKRALCVGNNYPGTSAELSGCVNDAIDWSELLVNQGYQVELIFEATKEEAAAKLNELVALTGFGDRLVFTFSGHGTYVVDRSGDEADRRDEALVMADYADGGLLIDDELQEVFGKLGYGAGGLILSDSCHSGTVAKNFAQLSPGRPKFLSPVEFTDLSEAEARDLEKLSSSASRPTASLISGCEDSEFSYDASFNGRPNGAFTRVAIDCWTPGIDLNRWHKAIRDAANGGLPSETYPQSPALTATPYRKYTRAL